MREKAPVQTVLDIGLPSSSTSKTSDANAKQISDVDTPVKTGIKASGCERGDVRKSKRTVKSTKKVNFSSPPKWKTKHFVGGSKVGRIGNGRRTALKPLQPNVSNTKLLVGYGSPRICTVGKRKEVDGSKIKRVVIECTSPQSDKADISNSDSDKEVPVGTVHQDTRTEIDTKASVDYRMCTEDEPPVEYWQSLAEQRRLALAETLKENEELYTEVEGLKSKVADLESKVRDLEYFAMMYKLAAAEDP